MDANWFSDFELQEPTFPHQLKGDSFGQFTEQHKSVSFSQTQSHEVPLSMIISGSNINTTLCNYTASNIHDKPKTIVKTPRWASGITVQTSSPAIISFGSQVSTTEEHAGFYGVVSKGTIKQLKKEVELELPVIVGNLGGNNKRNYDAMITGEGMRKGGTRSIYGQREREEHILAERNRRAKLSQRFIALSKIVPGLKKMDKTSVLGDAIKHIQQLQDKLHDLKAQTAKQIIESAVIVKKYRMPSDEEDHADNTSSSNENLINKVGILKGSPEIEARMSDRTAIIKIHCENRKGSLVKVLTEIETLGLSITGTNVMPFGSSSLDITAIAKVEDNSMSVKDVVKKLNEAFKQFM